MNALFDSIFKTCFPKLATPPNFNLPPGCDESDVSPMPEQPPSEYVDGEDEPRENLED